MSGRPPLSFSSTRRPPGRRTVRVAGIVLAAVLVVVVGWVVLLGGLWSYAWLRLGGDELPALEEDELTTLGGQGPQAPAEATTVLLALTAPVDPTIPREPELEGPVVLVQAGGPRADPAVLVLPERLPVEVDGHGQLSLAGVQLEGGTDLLVRAVEDYTEVRIDHAASLSIDALPRLVDAVAPLEVCDGAGCSELTGEQLRTQLLTADRDGVIQLGAEVVRALAERVDRWWAATSPLQVRRVIDAVAQEVSTDVSLRGGGLLDVAAVLRTPAELDVEALPMLVDGSDEVLVLHEPAQVRLQHLRDGTPLTGADGEAEDLEAQLIADAEVVVLNGAGIDGLAGDIQIELESAGFVVVDTGNAPTFGRERTVVHYERDDADHGFVAARLAERLGGEVALEPIDEAPVHEGSPVDLLVIVGEDLAG